MVKHPQAFIVCITLFVFCPLTPATDWPQWFGPDRNGILLEPGWQPRFPKEGPQLLWRFRAGTGYSPVSVKDGRAYTLGYRKGKDVVYCLDAKTGDTLWSYSYPCRIHDYQHEGGPVVAPLIEEDRVYLMSRDCDAFCFDAETGKVIWSASAQENIQAPTPLFGHVGSPALIGDRLILDVGAVVALDKNTGHRIWRSEQAFKATCASPTPFDLNGRTYAAVFNATGLVIVDAETGAERWRKPWQTPVYDTNTGTPLVNGNRVFITSGFDGGAALLELGDAPEPKTLWEDPDIRTRNNTPRLYEGYLYFFDIDTLRCLEFETGRERWSKKWLGIGSLIIVNGILITLSERGEVVLVRARPDRYEEMARFHLMGGTCWTPPTFAGKRLYLRNSKGHVFCYDMTPEN